MKIIIASHGGYSSGILSALQVIFGDNLPYVVNTYSLNIGENVNDLAEEIFEEINEDELTIVLTDLLGGSVDNSVFPLVHQENVRIITGINLPFLLELMTITEEDQIDEQIDTIIERARDGLISKNKLLKEMQESSDDLEDLEK